MLVMRPNLAFMHNTCSWAVPTTSPAAASPPPTPLHRVAVLVALFALFIIQQKDSLCARERCTSLFQPSSRCSTQLLDRFILLACDSGKTADSRVRSTSLIRPIITKFGDDNWTAPRRKGVGSDVKSCVWQIAEGLHRTRGSLRSCS